MQKRRSLEKPLILIASHLAHPSWGDWQPTSDTSSARRWQKTLHGRSPQLSSQVELLNNISYFDRPAVTFGAHLLLLTDVEHGQKLLIIPTP